MRKSQKVAGFSRLIFRPGRPSGKQSISGTGNGSSESCSRSTTGSIAVQSRDRTPAAPEGVPLPLQTAIPACQGRGTPFIRRMGPIVNSRQRPSVAAPLKNPLPWAEEIPSRLASSAVPDSPWNAPKSRCEFLENVFSICYGENLFSLGTKEIGSGNRPGRFEAQQARRISPAAESALVCAGSIPAWRKKS